MARDGATADLTGLPSHQEGGLFAGLAGGSSQSPPLFTGNPNAGVSQDGATQAQNQNNVGGNLYLPASQQQQQQPAAEATPPTPPESEVTQLARAMTEMARAMAGSVGGSARQSPPAADSVLGSLRSSLVATRG